MDLVVTTNRNKVNSTTGYPQSDIILTVFRAPGIRNSRNISIIKSLLLNIRTR
jgi:hypothetical protein